MPETYYDVLGITRKVSKDELLYSFLTQALKWHPEHHPNNPEAARRFVLVAEAFCVLFDPKLRFRYDRALKENPGADEPMRVPLDQEKAHIVLRDILKDFVETRLVAGASKESIYNDLIEKQHCPPELASHVMNAGGATREERVRAAGMRMMWHGLGIFIVGTAITVGTILESGGGAFVLWYGPMIFGGLQFVTALGYIQQGKEPPRPYSVRDI